MIIAVLADIHSNDVALKAVLNDAQQFDAERFFILGDIIGYYYWPGRVLDLIGNLASVDLIYGNHECMLKVALQNHNEINTITKKYGSGIQRAIEKLTVDQQNFLMNQPSERQLFIDGCKFFLCHGSPFNNDQYVYPDAPYSLLQECAIPGCDFVFMGHTHYPMCFHHNNTVVINPGSVGQPRDVGNLAAYVIVDTQNRSVIFRRVQFDTESIIKECKERDPEQRYLSEVLIRNSYVRSHRESF